MSRALLALVLTLAFALGACAPDPLLSAPPPSRLVATLKLSIGPADARVDASRGDIYFIAESGKSIVVVNGLTVTHIISNLGGLPTTMHTALLPAHRLIFTLGTSRDAVAIIRDFEFVRQEPVALRNIRAIVADESLGMSYVVGWREDAQSQSQNLGFTVRFANDKPLPAIGLGRFFPTDALVDSIHGLLYVRGRAAEPVAQIAATSRITVENFIQVWRNDNQIASFPINGSDDLWAMDSGTGSVFLIINDQVLGKQVLRHYRAGNLIQDTAYPLVNGATRSCASSGSAIGFSSRDKRLYVADRCQHAILVFKDMVYEGFVPFAARDIYTMKVDQNRAIAYVPDIRDDKITALRGPRVLTTYATGWFPATLAVNPQNGWLYVGNLRDGTVSVFGY